MMCKIPFSLLCYVCAEPEEESLTEQKELVTIAEYSLSLEGGLGFLEACKHKESLAALKLQQCICAFLFYSNPIAELSFFYLFFY